MALEAVEDMSLYAAGVIVASGAAGLAAGYATKSYVLGITRNETVLVVSGVLGGHAAGALVGGFFSGTYGATVGGVIGGFGGYFAPMKTGARDAPKH